MQNSNLSYTYRDKIVHALKAALHQFVFENTETTWIAFFRIAIGCFVILHFLAILPDFDLLFSSTGILPSDILNVFTPSYMLTLPKIVRFLAGHGISEATTLTVFKISYFTLGFSLLIGFFPRLTALLLLMLQISLVKGASYYAYGADFFTSMSLFYLILVPSDGQYAILKSKKQRNISAYRRLFQLHLSIAYFFSGFDKMLGFNWWNGESIWKAINLPHANLDFAFDFTWMIDMPFVPLLIGWATIAIEMLYPIFIWIPATRKTWLLLTIGMHLGIALVLNLYFFSALMIIWNLANFYDFESKTSTVP